MEDDADCVAWAAFVFCILVVYALLQSSSIVYRNIGLSDDKRKSNIKAPDGLAAADVSQDKPGRTFLTLCILLTLCKGRLRIVCHSG